MSQKSLSQHYTYKSLLASVGWGRTQGGTSQLPGSEMCEGVSPSSSHFVTPARRLGWMVAEALAIWHSPDPGNHTRTAHNQKLQAGTLATRRENRHRKNNPS